MAEECEPPKRLVKPEHARSPYWDHFGFEVNEKGEKVKPVAAICKLCAKEVACSGNTTNLLCIELLIVNNFWEWLPPNLH